MRTLSSCGSSSRRSTSHRRIADFLTMGQDSDDEGGWFGGAMQPVLHADRADLVEVMLELDADSVVVRSVTPTSAAAIAAGGTGLEATPESAATSGNLSRSSSTASRIRRNFPWVWTPSPRRSTSTTPWLQPPDDPAVITARDARRIQARLQRTRSGAQQALKGLRFISSRTTGREEEGDALWRTVEDRFHALAKDGLLSREDFGECIGMVDSKEFARGIFDALARRRRQILDKINKEELRDFWLQISDHSFDARLQIFFDMVDTNVDGRITREEVQELITLSASANKLSKLKEQAEEYAALIMEELDPENLGYIELWQLEALLLQRDHYMNYSRPLSTASMSWSQNITAGAGAAAGWLLVRPTAVARRLVSRLRCLVQEQWQRAWVLLLWFAVMAGLFAWKFTQYRRRSEFRVLGYCLPTAKGAAETLKLNMALILLPVSRNTLTWLRSTRARLFVPFDDNINFHKTIAGAIVVGILLHAGNHLACDFPRLIRSSPQEYSAYLAADFGDTKPTYLSLLSGVEGVTGLAMVVLMVVSFTLATSGFRKGGLRLPAPLDRLTGFNAFWYSHHLLAVVYVLLLVHGSSMYLVHHWYQRTTWMYLAVPLLLYLGERTLRTLRSEVFTVKILKVSVLPGNVLTLMMSKPHGFRYKSGQYIFLKCPTISPFEWHPFSITSAPGDDHLSVHIRTAGDWTQELRRVFTEVGSSSAVIGRARFSEMGSVEQKSMPRLLVDGPYGAPAQNYENYDVLLLVGLGIGATPFISILRNLLNNVKMAEEQLDSSCTDTSRSDDSMNSISNTTNSSSGSGNNNNSNKRRTQKTTSAHFYWVTREPGSFEWFKGVMNEVAEMDQKGVIEMHNYLTSVYEEGDARTTLLTMVQALNHAKHGVDIVSGTRVRTHFARPNWNDVFAKIAFKHPGATVGVFYCGTPGLSKEIKRLSHEFRHRTSTRFHFHKEYF
ncbi:hypothetical protein Taro_037792 [Colocasia esculenta]|uniref:Uncharacterized protein n=1 Tax=Colocasia esculenta TaxID=4460 RepID=A0A843WKB1_COLES|nr:hypothetical protein [Colocasia esculenta]